MSLSKLLISFNENLLKYPISSKFNLIVLINHFFDFQDISKKKSNEHITSYF
jgi:hypothetical protein